MGLDGFIADDRTRFANRDWQNLENDRKLGEFVDRVKESIEALQDAIRILAMGIDYRRYSRFRFLTPVINRNVRDDYLITELPSDHKITSQDVGFCIEFVIETSIKLQEFDYSIPSPFTNQPSNQA
jgi:hypothetical protein